jgi:aryl-alcohol dehydrogenase-like predicted oxidoreductase
MRRLGFGAHRASSPQHLEALRHSLRLGVRVIDTSPNYENGESEKLVGTAVREFMTQGSRDELTIVTKVGVLQGSDLEDAMERERLGRPWPGTLKLSSTAWYCIAPEAVLHAVRASEQRLGTMPDAVLLHNPEFILADMLARHGPSGIDRDHFYSAVGNALGALSTLSSDGDGRRSLRLGLSANVVGCRYSVSGRANDLEAVELPRVLAAASEAGVDDASIGNLNLLQVPLNLLEPDAALGLRGGSPSPMEAAQALGFKVLAHRPIHAIPPLESLARGFGVAASRHLSLRDGRPPISPTAALVRSVARDALAPHLPNAHTLALEEIALLFVCHAPAADCALVGMRTPVYVDRAADLLHRYPDGLSKEAHAALAVAMRTLVDELASSEPHASIR